MFEWLYKLNIYILLEIFCYLFNISIEWHSFLMIERLKVLLECLYLVYIVVCVEGLIVSGKKCKYYSLKCDWKTEHHRSFCLRQATIQTLIQPLMVWKFECLNAAHALQKRLVSFEMRSYKWRIKIL